MWPETMSGERPAGDEGAHHPGVVGAHQRQQGDAGHGPGEQDRHLPDGQVVRQRDRRNAAVHAEGEDQRGHDADQQGNADRLRQRDRLRPGAGDLADVGHFREAPRRKGEESGRRVDPGRPREGDRQQRREQDRHDRRGEHGREPLDDQPERRRRHIQADAAADQELAEPPPALRREEGPAGDARRRGHHHGPEHPGERDAAPRGEGASRSRGHQHGEDAGHAGEGGRVRHRP
jgi:hypothetical protein